MASHPSPALNGSLIRTGSCLCGAVTFEAKGKEAAFILCHCRSCKKNTGCPYTANAWFKKTQVQIKGDHNLGQYQDTNTDTGGAVDRNFCKICGSPMFVYSLNIPDTIVVPSGLFDEDYEWSPVWEQYTSRKTCFVTLLSDTKKYEKSPTSDVWDEINR